MDWLMRLVAVVLLGVLVELLLPAGQMSKYIKGIFVVLLLLVLLSPLPTFLSQKDSLFDILDLPEESYQTDDTFIHIIDSERQGLSFTQRVAHIRTVYPQVQSIERDSKCLSVHVQGTLPSGLSDYICEVFQVSMNEVIIYEKSG